MKLYRVRCATFFFLVEPEQFGFYLRPPGTTCVLKIGAAMISRSRNRHHLFAYARHCSAMARETETRMEIHDDESLLGNYHHEEREGSEKKP